MSKRGKKRGKERQRGERKRGNGERGIFPHRENASDENVWKRERGGRGKGRKRGKSEGGK